MQICFFIDVEQHVKKDADMLLSDIEKYVDRGEDTFLDRYETYVERDSDICFMQYRQICPAACRYVS